MKYPLIILVLIVSFAAMPAHAQMMMSDEGDAAGSSLWSQLQSKQISCDQLSDDDFADLGDYFMGLMMGSSHESMDQLMTDQIGQDNDRLMHIAMGKRFSGCDESANYPSLGYGYMPMMMWGGYQGQGMISGFDYSPSSIQAWLSLLVSVVWLVAGILAIAWLWLSFPKR